MKKNKQNFLFNRDKHGGGFRTRLLAFILVLTLSGIPALATIYYINATNGNDRNTGTSAEKAWKNLDKVNNTIFCPGDKILFKTGSQWTGQLKPQGSGKAGSPIVIDQFGIGKGIKSLSGYFLKPDSPCIGSGLFIKENGGRDFWGNILPLTSRPDIGACQVIPIIK